MARSTEVKVGSVGEWVVRLDGKDLPVAVLGREGKKFKVRRVDSGGKPYGRTVTRGAGALRRPGQPARANPKVLPGGKKATKGRAPRARKPSTFTSVVEVAVPASAKASPTPKLPSLRGAQRATPNRTKAPPKKREEITVRPPNELVKRVIRRLEKAGKDANSYVIRNLVAEVLADHDSKQFFAPWR